MLINWSRRTRAERRASFAQINASWAIEGQLMDAADLVMQERLIRGEITHEQAIDEVKNAGRFGHPTILKLVDLDTHRF